MKKLFIYLIILNCAIASAQETAQNTDDQQLTWKGEAAVGGYSPEGTLDIISAKITYTSEQIESLEIVVDMKSLQQENKQLEGHLKEKDFFHVNKYPKALFVLNEPATITNGKAKLKGTFTIKSTSLKEVICATVQLNKTGMVISFEQVMDRTQYGITYNSPSVFEKIKENAIADDFLLKGTLIFKRD